MKQGQPTRYAELEYHKVSAHDWRIILVSDNGDGSKDRGHIHGPYPTKLELLCDLANVYEKRIGR